MSLLPLTDPCDAVPRDTVQYTDVDGECDKLAPDDGHQFTTLTVTVQ